MSEKVYPMDESYNKAAADLLELIEARDLLAEALKIARPEDIPEMRKLLADTNAKIEECEAALAAEYEAYQNHRRLEEERDEMLDDMMRRMEMVFIHVKYRHPEKLEEMKAALFNEWTPEEIEAFYDRVAVLEAGDLISIIAQQGETREETEEFLKNFRAAQG